MKRFYRAFSIVILCVCLIFAGCSKHDDESYNYDIEKVFTDDVFISIIEGETFPVEIKVGFGGENGYEQFSSADPGFIAEYIEAFRAVQIKREIKDKSKWISVCDGVIDYTFITEDGTEIVLGTDLNEFVTDREREIEFQLGNIDKFIELNRKIQGI